LLVGCATPQGEKQNTKAMQPQSTPIVVDVVQTPQLWQYEDGVVTIESQEQMDAFAAQTQSGGVRKVIVKNGVTHIPDAAFYEYPALETVVLPDGLISIGDSAFAYCTKLLHMEIPASVNEIGGAAFIGCKSLLSVDLPEGLTVLKDNMFVGCDSLKELRIPMHVRELWEQSIRGETLKRLIFEGHIESIIALYQRYCPRLKQVMFLDAPPMEYGIPAHMPEYRGLDLDKEQVTFYYLRENAHLWAPNGETTWEGYSIVPINSLDDLPPL